MTLINSNNCPCETCGEWLCHTVYDNPTYCDKFNNWLDTPAYDVEAIIDELADYLPQGGKSIIRGGLNE